MEPFKLKPKHKKVRVIWNIKPFNKIKESKKKYNRKKEKLSYFN